MFAKEIKLGIALLDRKLAKTRPEWRKEIDLERLDMFDPQRCVLGQLFGTYESGLIKLGISFAHFDQRFLRGFSIRSTSQGFNKLTAEWRAALSE